MSQVITKTKSGLVIEKIGNKFVASKGNVVEMYNSLDALTRAITPKSEGPKPKKAKASKPRKAKASKPRKAKKSGVVGHKPGCQCVACSPATRARGMKALRKAQKAPKAKKARRAPRHPGGRMSVDELRAREAEAARFMPQSPRVYRGKPSRGGKVIDVGRFNKGGGRVFHMPERMPVGFLGTGRGRY